MQDGIAADQLMRYEKGTCRGAAGGAAMLHPTILDNLGSASTRTALFRGEDAVTEKPRTCPTGVEE